MTRYSATVSSAGIHGIQDNKSGELICIFMLGKGRNPDMIEDHLNTCLRALNYIHEQRVKKNHDR